MKHIAIILLTFVFAACQEVVSFRYSETGMGYKISVEVDETMTTVHQMSRFDGGQEKTLSYETDPTVWKKLLAETKAIDVESIDTLESPTNLRQTDAAKFTRLEVTTTDTTYQSQTFDSGRPPLTLKGLVDELVKIKKAAEEELKSEK